MCLNTKGLVDTDRFCVGDGGCGSPLEIPPPVALPGFFLNVAFTVAGYKFCVGEGRCALPCLQLARFEYGLRHRIFSTIRIRLLYSHRLVRKPEPRSNQSHHPRFDNSYCQAATEDYPCAEHQSLRLGLHICHAPIAIVELHGLSLITVLWIIKQITIIAFSKTGVSP